MLSHVGLKSRRPRVGPGGPDISDTLPGVAIAISLVPPLAVAGLTLQSGAPGQCLGALLLFATNVAAILASGIVVMTLYRTGQVSGQPAAPAFGRPIAVVIIDTAGLAGLDVGVSLVTVSCQPLPK
jgi:hypothetical protein